jgi:DNA-binding transcriptional LysR family regulator
VLAPVLIDYLVRYPRMQVEVEELELMPRLIEDGYDAALFYGDLLPQEMISVPLGPQQRYLVVGSPDYLARRGTLATPRICASTTASVIGSRPITTIAGPLPPRGNCLRSK